MSVGLRGPVSQQPVPVPKPQLDQPGQKTASTTTKQPVTNEPSVADGVDTPDANRTQRGEDSAAGRAAQGITTQTGTAAESTAKNLLIRGFMSDLRQRAQDPESFAAAMRQSFGADTNLQNLETIRQRVLAGDTSWLPTAVRFVDSKELGQSVGASYSPQGGGTVLLARDLRNLPERLRAAFSEQIGHHLDALRQLEPAKLEAFLASKPGDRAKHDWLAAVQDSPSDRGGWLGAFLSTSQLPRATGHDARRAESLGEVEHHTPVNTEPRTVRYDKPSTLAMHPSWANTPLAPAISNNELDLNAVTPEMLRNLSATDLRTFFGILEGFEVKATVTDASGETQRGRTNAATAMAARVWGSGNSEVFARVFAAAPNRILPFLNGNGARVLTADNLALIMREMRTSDGHYTTDELDALGALTQKYLEINVGKDPKRVGAAMRSLLTEIKRSGLPYNAENAGVVSGVIVAGMLRHFEAIRASDMQRARIIDNVASTVSDFVGAFKPWGDAVAAGVSALNVVYQEIDRPRDYAEHASRFQATLQLAWLQNPPQGWSRDDVQDAIMWIDTTIKSNGQR